MTIQIHTIFDKLIIYFIARYTSKYLKHNLCLTITIRELHLN